MGHTSPARCARRLSHRHRRVPNTLVTHDVCPVSDSAVQTLLQRRPELLVDDVRPSHEQLRARLASMWLADETVLYVGLAGTSIARRLRQYYRTPLGARNRTRVAGR